MVDMDRLEYELLQKTRKLIRNAAFNLESLAHLRDKPSILPMATELRRMELELTRGQPPSFLVTGQCPECYGINAHEMNCSRRALG